MSETPPDEQELEHVDWPDPADDPDEEPAESLDDDGTPGTGTFTEPADELDSGDFDADGD